MSKLRRYNQRLALPHRDRVVLARDSVRDLDSLSAAQAEVRKSTDPCRCCWHCRHYVRPLTITLLDGPVTDICTVDRYPGQYLQPDQWHQGDKDVLPDDYCERFEINPSPSQP